LIVFLIPALLTAWIYHALSPQACFTYSGPPTQENAFLNYVQQQTSSYLGQETKTIQSLGPLVPLGSDWFNFDVSFRNNLKVALVVTQPQSYTVATTTFVILTASASSTVPYQSDVPIAKAVQSNQISNLITGWGFQTNAKPVLVGPHQWVSLQTNPDLGFVCINVSLEGGYYAFLIYLEISAVFIGLAILFREALAFIIRGFGSYFISR